jgi:hypothetical protein
MDTVLIHGWSDKWESMKKVGDELEKNPGWKAHYINYNSLDDQACYEDFAEGLHERLEQRGLLNLGDRQLHFVTHSTGALVLRQWLRQYAWAHVDRKVGNVIFLAPANFGSPLAHKGSTLLGKLAKARKWGEDIGEVGEEILRGLELASPFQWSLAEFDLFNPQGTLYGGDKIRASVITGCKPYGGLRKFVNEDGTDGTIVVAGANLNSRKLVLDFAHRDAASSPEWFTSPALPNLPFAIHNQLDHSMILEVAAHGELKAQIEACLKATDAQGYEALQTGFQTFTDAQTADVNNYQQFVVQLLDDRGMPINDYHVEFNVWERTKMDLTQRRPKADSQMSDTETEMSGDLDEMLRNNVHIHSAAPHMRRFLVQPEKVDELLGDDFVISMKIDADTNDDEIHYATDRFENFLAYDPKSNRRPKLFFENTTTLVDVWVDRYSELVTVHP